MSSPCAFAWCFMCWLPCGCVTVFNMRCQPWHKQINCHGSFTVLGFLSWLRSVFCSLQSWKYFSLKFFHFCVDFFNFILMVSAIYLQEFPDICESLYCGYDTIHVEKLQWRISQKCTGVDDSTEPANHNHCGLLHFQRGSQRRLQSGISEKFVVTMHLQHRFNSLACDGAHGLSPYVSSHQLQPPL